MDLQDRIKVTIQILIGFKVAENQENIGKLLGYSNKSYFSQIINGKASLPSDFLEKLSALDERISKKWLYSGVGNIETKQVYDNDILAFVAENKAEYGENWKEKADERLYTIELQKKEITRLESEIKQLKKTSKHPILGASIIK